MSRLSVRVSLCMIVRNEERMIKQCLASVKDIVQEIIVVDTGSRDRTVEIAKSFGAKIYSQAWSENFSEARNHSISHASGDWILVLDADEKLARRDAVRVFDLVRSTSLKGYKLTQRTYLWNANVVFAKANPGGYDEGASYRNCVDVSVVRLFRNDPAIRYQGRVHELVDPVFDDLGLSYAVTPLVIHHFGKVGNEDRLENKRQLYLDLGRRKVAEEPGNPMAHFELGVQLFELKKLKECIPFFQEAYRLNKGYNLGLLYLAKACQTTGRMEEAERYYRKCLGLAADDQRVLFEYANFQRDRGHLKASLRTYKKCLALDSRHALATFNLGGVYLRLNQIERGFSLLKRAISLDPDNQTFRENFGRLSLQGVYLEEAAGLLEDYLQRFPQSAKAAAVLSEVWLRLGNFQRALDWAGHTLQVEPRRQSVLPIKGHALLGLGRLAEAEEAYLEVLARHDSDLDSLMNLAAIAQHRGDLGSMERHYLALLDHHPEHPVALKRLGTALARRSPDKRALEIMERAYLANPTDTECLLLLATLLEKNGRTDEAIGLYRRAGQANPKLVPVVNQKIRRLESGQVSQSGTTTEETGSVSVPSC